MTEWTVKGRAYGSCNCDHCCPCQFEGLPTHGRCEGFEIVVVEEGHHGDVNLAGVVAATVYSWPGPVFEGGGTIQSVIDSSATPEQREAISRILKGKDTKEFSNIWSVFSAMSETQLEDLFLPIEHEMDLDARTASVSIPGYLESTGEPIRNPFDGGTHRVQIRHPEGIESDYLEIGNATTRITGPIALSHENSYGQWNRLDFNQDGPAHSR